MINIFKKYLLIVFFALSGNIYAEDIKISNIIIQGNNRVTNATVLNYAEINQGDIIRQEKIQEIIKKLYDTGYFDDIEVELKFNDLIIKLDEKPIISDIVLEDNNIIEDEDILNALENVGITRSRPFDKNIFDKVEQELVRLYFDRGRYNASIETNITNLERNRVSINLKINEGEPSRIREINIIGNSVFSSKKLKNLMKSGTKYFYMFWSDKDVYSNSVLKTDISKIEEYYFNRGYIRFRVLSNQVNLSNNNQDIIITINVDEGEKYEFGDIKLYGNTVLDSTEVKKYMSQILLPKQTFSRRQIQEAEVLMKNMLGEKGYAFPEIISAPIVDDETRIVDVEFRVTPGNTSKVRRITISGNDSTNDEVYRREIRQMESAIHKQSAIDRSKIRLQRLKFVDNVEVVKTRVPDSPDQIDIAFKITERKAGEFKVSAGWSDTDGAIFDIDLKQDNFLGGGNNVAVKASRSSVQTAIRLLVTDPYYTMDGVSRTTSLVVSETDVSGSSTASYLSDTIAGGIIYNTPLSETESFGLGYDLSLTKFTTTIGSPIIVTHHLDDHGSDSLGVMIKAEYVSDTRNRTRFAESGMLNQLSTNIFLAAEGASYITSKYETEYNLPYIVDIFGFDWNTVFQTKTIVGVGAGLIGATSMPFYSKFFAGGNRTVRGYKASSLGPLTYNAPRGANTCAAIAVPGQFIECDAVGGDFLTAFQFDWLFPPPPILAEDNRNIRTSLFVDVGQVFEDINDFDYNDLRGSYGFQFNVQTPVGGVSIGIANSLFEKEGDDFQSVIFRLGGNF